MTRDAMLTAKSSNAVANSSSASPIKFRHFRLKIPVSRLSVFVTFCLPDIKNKKGWENFQKFS